MTIRRELTRLAIASVLPATLAAGLLIAHTYQRQVANIEQSTLETAQALAQTVDGVLASGRTALQALATSPYLASGDLAAFDRQAREALRDQLGNNFVVSDASGQQLINTLRPFGEALPRHGNPSQLRQVFETGQPAVSDLYMGAVARRPLIAIDVPVRRGDEVIFDLSMGFFPDRLGEVLSRQSLPPGWVGAIFDSHGTIVARTHDADRYIGKKGAPALVQRMAQVPEGFVETDTLEGVPVVAVFSRSAESNWSVAIGIPRAELARELWTPLLWIIAGAVVLLAAGIGLAQVLGARIAASIRSLVPPAVALGRGEKVTVPPLRLEEADEVGRALMRASTILHNREEILAIVAHDLRNPLSVLMLDASTATRRSEKLPGSEPVREMLASIKETARRMSGMVDDLLAVSVSTIGEQSMLKISPVSATSLLARAADSVRPLFLREGIELKTETMDALPDIEVDQDRVLRVFINLLDNALKFTPRPGHVVLRAEKAAPGVMRFSISNSGPAVAADELEKMFQPFWQAREEGRRGVGLGLSISRSIIETHGGRIWAQPEPGMRVRICFELPLTTPASRPADMPADSLPAPLEAPRHAAANAMDSAAKFP